MESGGWMGFPRQQAPYMTSINPFLISRRYTIRIMQDMSFILNRKVQF